ncbi:hypothetical protein EVAR_28211_1 [Eumeta japonica]|uniref:Uncharacterized protein n=1 Tax=Eumeta variegata TaxID=151549 RepID=A0A4C1VIC2_EUMVA|nr:hypothetical protein EVAR_28211_1 [Eumeta japonica]
MCVHMRFCYSRPWILVKPQGVLLVAASNQSTLQGSGIDITRTYRSVFVYRVPIAELVSGQVKERRAPAMRRPRTRTRTLRKPCVGMRSRCPIGCNAAGSSADDNSQAILESVNKYYYYTRTRGLFRICYPKDRPPNGQLHAASAGTRCSTLSSSL